MKVSFPKTKLANSEIKNCNFKNHVYAAYKIDPSFVLLTKQLGRKHVLYNRNPWGGKCYLFKVPMYCQ